MTYDDLRAAARELAKLKGVDPVTKVLKTFGAEKAQDIPPEKYAEALAALRQEAA